MIVHYSGFCMGRLGKRYHGRSRRALNFEDVEEEQFQAEIAKLEVGQKEEIMQVMTI